MNRSFAHALTVRIWLREPTISLAPAFSYKSEINRTLLVKVGYSLSFWFTRIAAITIPIARIAEGINRLLPVGVGSSTSLSLA